VDGHTEEDKMGGTCGTCERENKYVPYSVLMGKPDLEEREQLKGLSVDVWMIFKWILKKLSGRLWTEFIWLRIAPSAGLF
jgi:hypothetical protein